MEACHLNLDDAWGDSPLGLPRVDAREWGPRLRRFAPEADLSTFAGRVLTPLPPLVVYGSGDFHHLSGWLLRRVSGPVTVLSFDSQADWDVRPPRWTHRGWLNRAIELPRVARVAVWGCDRSELNWPSLLFANRGARRCGRITVYPWADRPAAVGHAVTRENWRERFLAFLKGLAGTGVYVTLDLGCLRGEDFTSNRGRGRFTAEDLAWAVERVRTTCRLVAGDVCGAYSPFHGERTAQRLANAWNQRKQTAVDLPAARARNLAALAMILPALQGSALTESTLPATTTC